MDVKVPVTVEGLEKALAKLNSYKVGLGPAWLGRALKTAGQIIADEAKRKAPVRSGALRKSITVEITKRGKYGAEGRVGPRKGGKNEAYHAHFVEFGTGPHEITTTKRTLADRSTGSMFGRTVSHPGARAQPFLRPAADEKRDEVLRFIEAAVRQVLER